MAQQKMAQRDWASLERTLGVRSISFPGSTLRPGSRGDVMHFGADLGEPLERRQSYSNVPRADRVDPGKLIERTLVPNFDPDVFLIQVSLLQ